MPVAKDPPLQLRKPVKKIKAYVMFLGKDEYKTVQVLETHYITGLLVLAEAAQLALTYPDVSVTVEIVVG